jgi:high-affinity iron transporter
MLTAVVIILKEFLEASILISLLLLIQKKFYPHPMLWKWIIFLSLAGMFCFSQFFQAISEQFDGRGQEILNTLLLITASLSLALHLLITYALASLRTPHPARLFAVLAITTMLIVACSITREGAEIIVYLRGTLSNPHHNTTSTIVGSIIGAGLGICIGILIFFLLYTLSSRTALQIIISLMVLTCAGLMVEATQNLIQAGLILAGTPVWDSSALLSESSVAGQLMYAMFGYEATPSRQEITAWLIMMVGLLGGLAIICFKKPETAQ